VPRRSRNLKKLIIPLVALLIIALVVLKVMANKRNEENLREQVKQMNLADELGVSYSPDTQIEKVTLVPVKKNNKEKKEN